MRVSDGTGQGAGRYDVIIVGAGPAGLALAGALGPAGLRIALIERQSAEVLAEPPRDGRDIALTHRSADHLRALGAWQRLGDDATAPLREARVWNGRSRFALCFATDSGAGDPLGHLVSNHDIRRTLYAAVAGQPGLDLHAGRGVVSAATSDRCASVVLNDGEVLEARLLVAADSRFSAVRDQLGIGAEINRLGRSMMVCRVSHARDHGGIATEWFDYRQTIAMLPLNGRTSSAVLTLAAGEIERLAALDPAALGDALTRRFGGRLGAMWPEEAPHVYPLATTYAEHFAATRAALVGDAAVGMHPVTAHGFNLGLRGAMALGALVCAAAAKGRDIGAPGLLRRYEAGHRRACRPLYLATNMIVALYTSDRPLARLARHAGLRAAARTPLVRTSASQMLMQR